MSGGGTWYIIKEIKLPISGGIAAMVATAALENQKHQPQNDDWVVTAGDITSMSATAVPGKK